MNALIEVFRMSEVSAKTRAEIIIKLGMLINQTYSSNITEPLVLELVNLLVPDHEITTNPHYTGIIHSNAEPFFKNSKDCQ